jgi:uncharacterized SAM-binding protein YcdF (DUF218 family)
VRGLGTQTRVHGLRCGAVHANFTHGNVTSLGRAPSSSTALRRWLRLASRLFAGFGLSLVIVLYTPVTEWMGQPLYEPPPSIATVDAIVVLEAWAFDDGELNESGVKRALRGAELYREGVASTVVLTGLKSSASRTGSALQPMARMLEVAGVPPHAILMEDASNNTHESAAHVAAISRARGWTRILLVTDASHMRRATRSFRKEGLNVECSPTLVWYLGGAQPWLRFARVSTLVHEYAGLAYYWWRGWI